MDGGQRRRASGPAIRRGFEGVRKASKSGLGSRSVAEVDGRSAGGGSGDPSAPRVSGGLVKTIAGVGRLTRAGAMARPGVSAAVEAPDIWQWSRCLVSVSFADGDHLQGTGVNFYGRLVTASILVITASKYY